MRILESRVVDDGLAASKTVTSAHIPGPQQPAVALPDLAAFADVILRMASSSVSTFSSRT